jgi:multicomponent Na+:H+ antiporter subunit E
LTYPGSYLRIIIPLLIIYLALTSNVELSNIIMGLLIASAVAFLIGPQRQTYELRRLPAALFAMGQYTLILMIDIIKNGIQVARILLTPSLPIQPGIISIPSHCDTEFGTALSAHAITVSPGELVVEVGEDGTMYTHCLDATNSEVKAAEAQKMRVNLLQKIFP